MRIFLIAEVFILVFALVLALIRGLPGPVFFPFRALATIYSDFFRGIPTILLVYILGFGVTALGALLAATVTGTISPRAVLLPIGFLWLLTLTIGTILLFSCLAVRFRDIISIVPFILQVGLFRWKRPRSISTDGHSTPSAFQ